MVGGRHECRHGYRHVVDSAGGVGGVGGLIDGIGGLVDVWVKQDIKIGKVRPLEATCRPKGLATGGPAYRATWVGVGFIAGIGPGCRQWCRWACRWSSQTRNHHRRGTSIGGNMWAGRGADTRFGARSDMDGGRRECGMGAGM